MKIILAQGNPESRFDNTRHNVGFALLDTFAGAHNASFSEKPKFHAFLAELAINGEKVLLIKPTTFYNDTGLSARALVDFYKLDPATDLLVIHDDLVLPLGTIRIRSRGGDAGNNGIKSLNAHLGENYYRIRIGIGQETHERAQDMDFVLGKFTKEESDLIRDGVAPRVSSLITDFINETLELTSMTTE